MIQVIITMWTKSYLKDNQNQLNVSLLDMKMRVRSLCPALGEPYAEMYYGRCPKLLQSPYKKNFNVTFVGTEPFIDDDDFEIEHHDSIDSYVGSEFTVMKIFAEKFKFFPNFMPETESYDGMLHKVKQ